MLRNAVLVSRTVDFKSSLDHRAAASASRSPTAANRGDGRELSLPYTGMRVPSATVCTSQRGCLDPDGRRSPCPKAMASAESTGPSRVGVERTSTVVPPYWVNLAGRCVADGMFSAIGTNGDPSIGNRSRAASVTVAITAAAVEVMWCIDAAGSRDAAGIEGDPLASQGHLLGLWGFLAEAAIPR